MKRFFSPLALSVFLITSAAAMTSCQQQNASLPEEQQISSGETENPAETKTAAVEEAGNNAIAKETTVDAEAKECEAIYAKNCKECHTLAPPATSAPSIVALAGQYRARYSKKEGAVADMVSYMKAPSIGKSILGPKTFERFGIMPAMTLPDEELEKVAGWLWDQYDPNFEGDGDCQ